MDKKSKKKSVIKRKTGEENNMEVDGKKQKIIVSRSKLEDVNKADKVEVSINQAVEIPVQEQSHEIVHTGQLVEGNFDQPVFVNMKGEPVQLGPNTVIVYEQSGNPSNFAFGGMWSMDQSGRLVMAETLYDVKGEPEDEGNNFVQAAPEQVEEPAPTYQQYELSNASAGTVDSQEYEVSIIDPHNDPENADQGSPESMQCMASTEEELATIGPSALRWLNQKYDYVVRKLQLNYDAGVKLLHSPTGCIQCVFFTTPSMQLAFNAVPQFLCIETGIEFTSSVPAQGGGTAASIRQSLCLFLAEDGNGRSVIVSAGISTFGDNVRWLLETFKSSNPAWRQVRCIVAEPSKHDQAIRASFPLPHCAGSVWQTCSRAARELLPLCRRAGHPCTAADLLTRLKLYALAVLRDDQPTHATQALRRGLLGPNAPARLIEAMLRADGPVSRLDTCLEGENYTNILHKGLERLTGKFSAFTRSPLQPDDFVTCFFEVAHSVEEERKNYALTRLRETEESKQSPTDTITQYAYNLMSHQTSLAQKCLDDRGGRRHSSAAICKYGTSTQECSCLFSKVFRLPCRHILMLTTELKVKTHIPFEPRWTVQHCLFGCETATSAATTPTSNTGATYMEQMVVEDNGQHRIQQAPPLQQVQTGLRQPQYVLAGPGQNAPAVGQVIFCNTSPVNAVQNAATHAQLGGQPVITSVVHTTQGGAVLTPTAGHDHA